MALKKEQNEFNYSERIGVNRGGGFEFAARVAGQTANALDSLTNQYADQALQDLKVYGKKVGEEAAQNAKFSKKEITYTDPITNETKTQYIDAPIPEFKATTKTMQEAYDKEIFTNYKNEVESTIRGIIIEERKNSIEANGTADDYEKVVRARLEPLYNSLEPKFKQVVQSYGEEQFQSHWYQVWDNKNRFDEKVSNLSYDSGLATKVQQATASIINQDGNFETNLKAVEDHINLYKGKNNALAIANGDGVIQAIKDGVQIYGLIGKYSVQDISKASPKQINDALENFKNIDAVISGASSSATLSDGTKITKASLNQMTNGNQTTLDNVKTKLGYIMTDLKGYYDQSKNEIAGLQAVEYNKIASNNGRSPNKFGISNKEYMKVVDSEAGFQAITKEYNLANSDNPILNMNDPRYVKLAIRQQNALPTAVFNDINNAFTNMNQNDIMNYYNNGTLPYILDYKQTFKLNGKEKAIKTNVIETLGFDSKVKTRMLALHNELQINPNIADAIKNVSEHFNKYEDGIKSDNISQVVTISSKGKLDVTKVNSKIIEYMEDKLDRGMFSPDATFPTQLYNQIKSKVYESIMDGLPIRKLSDIEVAVDGAMGSVLNGSTSYGYSKYGFNTFQNWGMEKGKFNKYDHFVFAPPEKYYSIPDGSGVKWMDDEVMNIVKGSAEWEAGLKNQKNLEFGSNIKLMAVDTQVPPRYYVVTVTEDGMHDILQDKEGYNYIYNPNDTYKKKLDEYNSSDKAKSDIEALKENRKSNLITIQQLEKDGWIKDGALQW